MNISITNTACTFEEIYDKCIDHINNYSHVVEVLSTGASDDFDSFKEIMNYQFTLSDISNNLIGPAREIPMKKKFDAQMSFDRNELTKLQQSEFFFPDFMNVLQDGQRSYPEKIFGLCSDIPLNQFNWVVHLLARDPSSRKGVMNISVPTDIIVNDRTCTNTLHFMIRNNELHLTVNMRSSHLTEGLEYDVYFFTEIQKLLKIAINKTYSEEYDAELRKDRPYIKVGTYTHFCTSLHVDIE